MTAKYAVIGHPLEHSLSPQLHNLGFQEYEIDACYEAIPLTQAELSAFLVRTRMEPIAGLSITIPHKKTIISLLDKITIAASSLDSVNTVFWKDGLLCGDNTDIIGVKASLQSLGPFRNALILGAGGASRAVVFALRELHTREIFVTARNWNRASVLATDLGTKTLAWQDRAIVETHLIVNTTPLGMLGKYQNMSPWPNDVLIPSATTVFDVVYNPLTTIFLAQAKSSGCYTISGLEMFLHQGLTQFRLWTGKNLDPNKIRGVLRKALME